MRRPDAARLRGRGRHAAKLAALLAVAGLVVPGAAVHPATISLTRVEQARHVDFGDGVVWILVLGIDARPDESPTTARTDAIQLVGLDLQSGRAAGIGIPRDLWVRVPGEEPDRINTVWQGDRTDLVATVVDRLLGITPDYVFVVGFGGFRDMVDTIGGVAVAAEEGFFDPDFDLTVREGRNEFDGTQALDYARSRDELDAGDFARSANQQQVMLGILRRLREHKDEDGFIERGALAAMSGLDTDLAPTELYRLAQAVTLVQPGRVTMCVVGGTSFVTGDGADVIRPDRPQARRLGVDARDARLDPGCQSG